MDSIQQSSLQAALMRIKQPKFDKRVKFRNELILVIALAGIACNIVQNEVLWAGRTVLPDVDPEIECARRVVLNPDTPSRVLKGATSALTVLLMLCIIELYMFHLKYERLRIRAPSLQLWQQKSTCFSLICELVVCALHPIPFVQLT